MSRHFKIQDTLNELEFHEYSALLKRLPPPTVDECLEWLIAKGYKVSRTAVWTHKKNFDQSLDSLRASAEMAKTFSQVAKESGLVGMTDATLQRVTQLQMEWAFSQANGGDLTAEDLERFAKSMNQLISAAQRNEDLRKRFDDAIKVLQAKTETAAAGAKGGISDADIAEARKAIFG